MITCIIYQNCSLNYILIVCQNIVNTCSCISYFNWITIATAFKYIFEETMPKLSVSFGNPISKDSHKNQYPCPVCMVCNFGFIAPQYSDEC